MRLAHPGGKKRAVAIFRCHWFEIECDGAFLQGLVLIGEVAPDGSLKN
jgi:hypothetical protein